MVSSVVVAVVVMITATTTVTIVVIITATNTVIIVVMITAMTTMVIVHGNITMKLLFYDDLMTHYHR